jgi:hypothetical protein
MFAVQGKIGSPTSRMTFVDAVQVTRQSVQDSGRELAAIPEVAASAQRAPTPVRPFTV